MGFDEKDAAIALFRTGENPDEAAALLLSSGHDVDCQQVDDSEDENMARAVALSLQGGSQSSGTKAARTEAPVSFEYGRDYPKPMIQPVSLMHTEQAEEEARQQQSKRDAQIVAAKRHKSSSGQEDMAAGRDDRAGYARKTTRPSSMLEKAAQLLADGEVREVVPLVAKSLSFFCAHCTDTIFGTRTTVGRRVFMSVQKGADDGGGRACSVLYIPKLVSCTGSVEPGGSKPVTAIFAYFCLVRHRKGSANVGSLEASSPCEDDVRCIEVEDLHRGTMLPFLKGKAMPIEEIGTW